MASGFEPDELQAANVISMKTANMWRMTNPEKNLRNYTTHRVGGLARNTGNTESGARPPEPGEQQAAGNTQYLVVPVDCAGLRLDQALVKLFPEYSRSRLQDWIAGGQVRVDGELATAKQKVWGGEKLEVLPQAHPADQPYLAENISLAIVYEDESLLVINKPVGLVVHPGSGNWEGTLLNALLHYAPQLAEVPRAGIVHRLDKDTSGLLVVAKTIQAQTALVRQLEARACSANTWPWCMVN